jgi:hypothetical protein
VPDWVSLLAWFGLLLFGSLFLVELLPAMFDVLGALVVWLWRQRRG